MLIYIHGVGSKPPAATLKQQWDAALFGRDMGDQTQMAYWASVLHPTLLANHEDEVTQAANSPYVSSPLGGLFQWIQNIEKAVQEKEIDIFDHSDNSAQGALYRILNNICRLQGEGVEHMPAELRDRIYYTIATVFFNDTNIYQNDENRREAIRDCLRPLLTSANEPITLVAHSLGTVVAFDVLEELRVDSCVNFITMGSPLGIPEIQSKLEAPDNIIRRCIRTWSNFYDLLDPVPAVKGLQGIFQVQPGIGVNVTDQRVINPYSLNPAHFNPHEGVGYLSTAQVRKAVYNLKL